MLATRAPKFQRKLPRPLTVDATFAGERPDLVADLVLAIRRVEAWAAERPDEAVRFIAREIGASEEAVRAAGGPDLARHLKLDLDPAEIEAIGHFKDFLHEWGFIPADFNVSD